MKRKIMYDQCKISSEEIKKQQNFDALLKKVQQDIPWKWKLIGFWGPIGTAAVALFFWMI